MMNPTIFIIIYMILFNLYGSNGYQFTLGDCPLYIEEPCDPNMIHFTLFTNTAKNISLNAFNLNLPQDFDFDAPLKFTIHGYGGLQVDRAIKSVTSAYRSIGYNVILVDWGPLASVPCYPTAYLNTWHVGQCIAILIVSLIATGCPLNYIHLVGFSLGAHIAGFAGHQIKKILGGQLNRITGLDPALPFFATPNDDWKLDPSDAAFVDVIHTAAGSFGKIEASGHVDFFMNGGYLQPFCYNAKYPPLCSHAMSGIYFGESITSTNSSFIGVECDNLAHQVLGFCNNNRRAIMGENSDYRIKGIFFVETADSPPFAKG